MLIATARSSTGMLAPMLPAFRALPGMAGIIFSGRGRQAAGLLR